MSREYDFTAARVVFAGVDLGAVQASFERAARPLRVVVAAESLSASFCDLGDATVIASQRLRAWLDRLAGEQLVAMRAWVERHEASLRAHPDLSDLSVDEIADRFVALARRWEAPAPTPPAPVGPTAADLAALDRALAKRARKNARRLSEFARCRR